MLPPFVVEEHDDAFWVHRQPSIDFSVFPPKRTLGALAYEESFSDYSQAQSKANEMEMGTGILW